MNIIETNLEFGSLSNRIKTNAIVLHHAQHGSCSVYDVHTWHKRDNGWSGIGYHFFITKNGQVYRGRPEKAVGAHCLHHNFDTIGICVQGDYMKERMCKVQEHSVIDLCKYLCQKYNIKIIKAHKELRATDCPGNNYPLEEIKNAVLNLGSKPKDTTYTIKKGDTLWGISRKYNTSVQDLKKLNNLTTDIIYPNQILKILKI